MIKDCGEYSFALHQMRAQKGSVLGILADYSALGPLMCPRACFYLVSPKNTKLASILKLVMDIFTKCYFGKSIRSFTSRRKHIFPHNINFDGCLTCAVS